MAKLLAEATIQGIEFTFERRTCGKDIYSHVICSHRPSGIGWSNTDKYTSTRIGVCREFANGQFTVDAWVASEGGQEHILHILKRRQQQSDDRALIEEAGLRPGDFIGQTFQRMDDSYTIRITGLTRIQALRTYKEAVLGIGEQACPLDDSAKGVI